MCDHPSKACTTFAGDCGAVQFAPANAQLFGFLVFIV
jgi:hypothetical protein